MLGEPRENAFLTCDFTHNDSIANIETHMRTLGRVRTSTTFPSLCDARIDNKTIVGIESVVKVSTVDYHGEPRHSGGDPIQAEVAPVNTTNTGYSLPIRIIDCEDGTYRIKFRAPAAGRYGITVTIFDRFIKDMPLFFDVSEHNNPVKVYGRPGCGKDEFMQPVGIAIDDKNQMVYVLDTGNSRIKVLSPELEFVDHISNEGLNGRSCTGNKFSILC